LKNIIIIEMSILLPLLYSVKIHYKLHELPLEFGLIHMIRKVDFITGIESLLVLLVLLKTRIRSRGNESWIMINPWPLAV
jgi:hypothetical protein